MIHNLRSLNLRLSTGGRHFRWIIAVDGDLLIGGRPVLLRRRRAAPELITFRFGDPIAAAAAGILVLVIHVAKAEGDRRPYHQGELPFWQRTAAGHATRGGHNSFDRELLFARGHGHDATPAPRCRRPRISHRRNWRENVTKRQVQATIMRMHARAYSRSGAVDVSRCTRSSRSSSTQTDTDHRRRPNNIGCYFMTAHALTSAHESS